MNTITRAELAHYPGTTSSEQLQAHHEEAAPSQPIVRPKRLGPLAAPSPTVAPVVDLRPFPGRCRIERLMQYLRAHEPRAEHWSEDALALEARRLLGRARIVE